ncbi:hypothetical protein [Aliikangiella sp. IMCC44359]|uniref:hypothetical protein n=1 Tax=Aliikangiella sp. IMCC44359 TaxID=3459125 RepID=UPI00403B03D5
MQNWPKDENIMSWDPENMEKYWELCRQYDQYPQLELSFEDSVSQQEFNYTYTHSL